MCARAGTEDAGYRKQRASRLLGNTSHQSREALSLAKKEKAQSGQAPRQKPHSAQLCRGTKATQNFLSSSSEGRV